jgi:hypothetical protein
MQTALLALVKTSAVARQESLWPMAADYGHAVLTYWWILMAAVAVLLVDVFRRKGKELKVSTWLKISAVICAFSVTQFLAYRDSLLNFEQVKHEKMDAIIERDSLRVEVARQQAKLEEKDSLIQSQQGLLNRKASSPTMSGMGVPGCSQNTVSAGKRLLDQKRENILVAMLQAVSATVEIQEPVNNDEASSYGSELIGILGRAGWSFRRIKWVIPEAEAPTGIIIRAGTNNGPVAAQLAKALSDLGVAVQQDDQMASSDWIEVYVGPKP